VRASLLVDDEVPSDRVKVIVENGTVYLMGIISEEEGDNAANLARNISGVIRVMKVFDYI
jgi:osmotically-inducible protein OsmY